MVLGLLRPMTPPTLLAAGGGAVRGMDCGCVRGGISIFMAAGLWEGMDGEEEGPIFMRLAGGACWCEAEAFVVVVAGGGGAVGGTGEEGCGEMDMRRELGEGASEMGCDGEAAGLAKEAGEGVCERASCIAGISLMGEESVRFTSIWSISNRSALARCAHRTYASSERK